MSTTCRRVATTALAALGFAIAGQASASVATALPALNITSPGDEFITQQTMGFRFSVLTNSVATWLGVFDSDRDGLASSAQVGIWDSTGQELVSVAIPSGADTFLDGYFRYVPIASVSLLAGRTYTIGAYSTTDPASSFKAGQGGTGTVNGDLNLLRAVYSSSTGRLSLPSTLDAPGGAYLGANFRMMAAPVPEPETFQMLALGLLAITGVAALRRRRQI